MQFTADAHDAIANGDITLTFRRWQRPHAKVGGRYQVGVVEIEVDTMELVPFANITTADLRRTGARHRDELRRLAAHSGPIDDDTLLYRIEFHVVGARRTRPVVAATDDNVATTLDNLAAIDRRSTRGPWTHVVLGLIDEHPGSVSSDLAAIIDRPRPEFKADVRKLKALGLTTSLEVGYTLTPLGRAVMAAASPRSKGRRQ